jgi:hypothetical protein
MKFYFHNVGMAGAAADFPKTVFTDLPISLVEANVPETTPIKFQLIQSLTENFQDGFFNCWGVPEGAETVIRNLKVGDAVLLVESIRKDGLVPALCFVRVYFNFPLSEFSKALWGSAHFPYIFFFKTEELRLTWSGLRQQLSYDNYRPPGLFLSIDSARLEAFGGPEGYLAYLRQNYSAKPRIVYSVSSAHVIRESPDVDKNYRVQVDEEMDKLVEQAMETNPVLKSGLSKVVKQTTSSPRDEAFRKDIRRIYGSRCAICGISLVTPDGRQEAQSAHIYPKEFDGSDDLRNGICLCHMHHWAFDAGWISLDDDLTILINKSLPESKEYDFIRIYQDKKIAKPIRDELCPHPIYLSAHRQLHGFGS